MSALIRSLFLILCFFGLSVSSKCNAEQHPTIQEVKQAAHEAFCPEEPSIQAEGQTAKSVTWAGYLSTLLEQSESLWFRAFLALILGLILSFTPCIYPMIPITIGIIGSRSAKSPWRNFFLSLFYVAGIACTFASLGLVAAYTGQMFGSLLAQPLFVLCIVAMLVYLAFAMIGFYDMYIPRFMQSSTASRGGGSLLSAFLFGVMSGTIASPCVSPGLILLLTLATTLNNIAMGFILLFAFGFGLGVPLIIVGTLSGSMRVLPRAGMWMVEVKRIFGFFMLGMCLYFLSTITPWYILGILARWLLFFIGFTYIFEARRMRQPWYSLKNIVIFLVLGALYGLVLNHERSEKVMSRQENVWMHNYLESLERARKEHKKILLDIVTPYCSLCKVIDKKIFAHPDVCDALRSQIIPLRIDPTDSAGVPHHAAIQEKFKIRGAPTCILIDPEDERELCRFSGDLCNMSPEEFLRAIGCR